jgi:hypothetical protein
MIIFTPTNLTLTEFEGTTGQTVTCNADLALYAAGTSSSVEIINVVCDNAPKDLNVTWSNNSFTFSSKFGNMFNRVLKFANQDANYNKSFTTTNSLDDIPPDFVGLYQYKPPTKTSLILNFNVTAKINISSTIPAAGLGLFTVTEQWPLTITYNDSYSNQKLIEIITKASTYKDAITSYPELL